LTDQEPEIPPPIAKFGIWPHFRIEYQGLGVGDDFETLGLALSWRELALETYRIVVEVDHGCPQEILDWVGLHLTKGKLRKIFVLALINFHVMFIFIYFLPMVIGSDFIKYKACKM
jgi:hypothetical protein